MLYAGVMPLRGYSPELRKFLLDKGRLYKLSKGQMIQSTEDRKVFNMIVSGYVKRYLISNDGSIGVQVLYGPGDLFPITLAFKSLFQLDISVSPEVYYYETMSDVEIYTVDLLSLRDFVKDEPRAYRDLMGIAGIRLQSTLNGLENITLRNSYKRVAHMLAYLARRFGKKTSAGMELNLNLTHQDLADILSLTRETVSTSIIKLRKKKLVKTTKGIVIPDLKKLEEEAYG